MLGPSIPSVLIHRLGDRLIKPLGHQALLIASIL
jgi:hypothetical protein